MKVVANDFELIEMNTDIFYMASRGEIDNIIKTGLKNEYLEEKNKFLAYYKFYKGTPGTLAVPYKL